MSINIFIQARMSSKRFPGKILAPFNGQPIIYHLVKAAQAVSAAQSVVVLTSTHASDDPLVAYLDHLKVKVFRGDLENVFARFKQAVEHYPCDRFVRLCADSPLMDPGLIQKMLECSNQDFDLTTNVYKRTFPKGLSVEVIKSETFLGIENGNVDVLGLEHVTSHFYRNPERYRIQSVELPLETNAENFCVDSVDDIRRLVSQKVGFAFNPESLFVRKV